VLLKLSGIAEDPGPDGPVRTAIISGLASCPSVKQGEMLGSQHHVAQIAADVADFVEADTKTSLRLAMK
jgi:hypothetical protein